MSNPGSLRHRLQIQTKTVATGNVFTTEDATAADSWATDLTVWGAVHPLRGTERFNGQQVTPDLSHSVEMRYTPRVNAENRILYPKYFATLATALNTTETAVAITETIGISASSKIRMQIDSELMEVTAGQGTTGLTTTRAVDGTTAASHSTGALVTLMGELNVAAVIDPDERNTNLSLLCAEYP